MPIPLVVVCIVPQQMCIEKGNAKITFQDLPLNVWKLKSKFISNKPTIVMVISADVVELVDTTDLKY